MQAIFKQIINEFLKQQLPKPTPREIILPALPPEVRKAFAFIGMRRSGKTWALYEQMQKLLQQNVRREQIIYINFEDDRLNKVEVKDLNSILTAYYELFPDLSFTESLYLFLDEIQDISGWEKFVRRLLDQQQITIYVSGSSAKLLSTEINTALRGRALTFEVFPFGFREYLHHKEISVSLHPTSKEIGLLQYHLNKFLLYGGFPETINVDASTHRKLLQNYIDTVIHRDIVERHNLTNVPVLKNFLVYCLQNCATLLSINKIYNTLKSQGYEISKNSLYKFVQYCADAFCLFSVPLYHFSWKKSQTNPKKIYPVDQGLITAYTLKSDYEQAKRLETTVFLYLRRKYQDIFYYQTKTGQQIDFLIVELGAVTQLYQVSWNMQESSTREREISALNQAMQELNIKNSTIITLNEADTITTEFGQITCVPLWDFLSNKSFAAF